MLYRRFPANEPLATAQQLLGFLSTAAANGQDSVLVVLTGKTGGPRSTGAMMAVLETGDRAGSISSGCVEAAIVGEALDVLAVNSPRLVRFGEGSRYIDIRLPCGAGMDLLFLPRPDPQTVNDVLAKLENREAAALEVGTDGTLGLLTDLSPIDHEARFVRRITPDLRLVVAGEGAEARALAQQAQAYGSIVEVLTPDEALLESAIRSGVSARILEFSSVRPQIEADPWTAIAIMFHDHDWEPVLIEEALATEAFWIGAMGSGRTAADRRSELIRRGLGTSQIERVRGPIGTIPSARNPATIALSALTEIVASLDGIEA